MVKVYKKYDSFELYRNDDDLEHIVPNIIVKQIIEEGDSDKYVPWNKIIYAQCQVFIIGQEGVK